MFDSAPPTELATVQDLFDLVPTTRRPRARLFRRSSLLHRVNVLWTLTGGTDVDRNLYLIFNQSIILDNECQIIFLTFLLL